MSVQRAPQHSISSTTVADLLERVLDKGIVIAGDIRIKLVDVELLTIQIRLVICSVDKACEMGLDWWNGDPLFVSHQALPPALAAGQTPAEADGETPRPSRKTARSGGGVSGRRAPPG